MKFYIFLLNLLCITTVFSQKSWDLKKDKNNIQVYTKSVDSSKIKACKIQTEVVSTLAVIKDIITDGDRLKEWNYRTEDSKLLEKPSPNQYIIWTALDLPWPLKNRDVILMLNVTTISKNTLRIDVMAAPEKLPRKKDYIRIEKFEGFWILEQKDSIVKITHQIHGDPSGNLPSWFVNSTITKAPYYNFLALKKRIQ